MAIVQISKMQQRAGNLVDLPQLDNAEFGWATDENRLFIGRTGNNYSDENIEVLTSYSSISFSQIDGSAGANFNVTTPLNGQILTYVSSTDTWENYKGTTTQLNGAKLQLGSASNLSIGGGAIGYVLQTDGSGNLSWTPQGTLYTHIIALSNANPIAMTVDPTTPYTNNAEITISGVIGSSTGIVNGKTFYIQLDANYALPNVAGSGKVYLYSSVGNSSPVDGSGLVYTNYPNAVATSSAGGGGGGNIGPSSDTQVQFNDGGVIQGSSSFTFNKTTKTLIVTTGNIVTGNVFANTSITAPVFVSNIPSGSVPFVVSSTDRVPNLNVSYANVSDYAVTGLKTTGTWYPIFVNATSGNLAQGANANLSFNVANGALFATTFVGNVSGNISGNFAVNGSNTQVLFNDSGNANATTGFTFNKSTGLVSITGNANVGNLNATGTVIATQVTANSNGLGTNFKVGDDAYIGDINITNTMVVKGQQDEANGYIIFGNGDTTSTLGRAGTGPLTYNGAFTIVGNANVGNLGFGSGVITGTGNITGGNLNITTAVIASTLTSNVATGTAPLTVTSTTVVPNLYVARSNVAEYSNVQTTGVNSTWYPVFVSANTSANYQLASNTRLSYNSSNGALYATTFVGNVSGNISGNLTVNGSNTQVLFNDSGLANATSGFTFNKSTGVVSITGNLVSGNANLGNAATANFFIGAGNNLSNIQGANVSGAVSYATTANAVAGANVSGAVSYATTANAVAGANVSGTVSQATTVMGATQNNITTLGALTTLSTGANTTAGTITGNWGLSTGSKLTATYADLAEYYEADKPYEPGTVLAFGGDKEVTIADDGTTAVAGVVSTNPAYVMNSQCQGEYIVALALQGRVPCKVRGTVRKGDMLVSGGDGYARPMVHPYIGSVIGKSLENFEGEGVIEVAVGRL